MKLNLIQQKSNEIVNLLKDKCCSVSKDFLCCDSFSIIIIENVYGNDNRSDWSTIILREYNQASNFNYEHMYLSSIVMQFILICSNKDFKNRLFVEVICCCVLLSLRKILNCRAIWEDKRNNYYNLL